MIVVGRDRDLALLQSAVEDVLGGPILTPRERDELRSAHPLVQSAALAAKAGSRTAIPRIAGVCVHLALQLADAKLIGKPVEPILDELRFSKCDPMWFEVVEQYLRYRVSGSPTRYISGGLNVLDVLPDTGIVGIIGDWGTGSQIALDVLRSLAKHKPDLVIHLGDVYYAGTPAEMAAHFYEPYRSILPDTPLYTLVGNHDLYSGGTGYYQLISKLGQPASYFCLRNAHWQFAAVDTASATVELVPSEQPQLMAGEADWLRARLADDGGSRRTVLLSHHQPFSAYEHIGDRAVNDLLLSQLKDVVPQLSAWIWGHEHDLILYGDYQGVRRGRCVGCSAVPVFAADRRTKLHEEVPTLPVRLGDDGLCYKHGYMVVHLDGAVAMAAYYQDDKITSLFEEEWI